MADLLRHLIVPGSPESFHTANSDKAPSPPPSSETTEEARLTSPRSENPCSTATVHTTALQAAGLPVYDIDEYLASPATQAILDSSRDPTEPVQIGGPKTSHFVPLLNTLCQAKGLTPVYEILAQDGRFGAKLIVGGETVEREGTWTTKKEAREKLAECGVEVVRDLTPTAASAVTNGDNWVGKLEEYHTQLSPPSGSPIYTTFALGPHFATEVEIPSQPTRRFGSRHQPFPSKRLAKAAAAHCAIEWLIAQGALLPDGTPIRRAKKPSLAPAAVAPASASAASAAWPAAATVAPQSFAHRVAALCPRLGLGAPEYRLVGAVGAPNFHSGAAWFPRDELVVEGPVGEVRDVFGRKNAREECAKGVLEFLERLARGMRRGMRDWCLMMIMMMMMMGRMTG